MINTKTMTVKSLAKKANEHHSQTIVSMTDALQHAMNAGDALIAAKEQLPHGQFGAWIESNCQFAERQARTYMQVSRNRETIKQAIQNGSSDAVLSIREAVNLLESNTDDEPEIEVEIPYPEIGEHLYGFDHENGLVLEIIPIDSPDRGRGPYVHLQLMDSRKGATDESMEDDSIEDRGSFMKRGFLRSYTALCVGVLSTEFDLAGCEWRRMEGEASRTSYFPGYMPEWMKGATG